ncbi:extracellular solute-binding protein [Bosea sp. LjRoot237]|uniref:extracellular solute-binding protein n=1 Tax=Bosea sp. LjRoot237 TaxID=3342292 RepID=UPI003ECC37BF
MLSRRLVLQAGLATVAAPALVRAQPGLSGTITLMSYAGIFQDNYTKAVIEPFQQAHPGVKVNYVPGGTSAQMVGSARAQKADPQVDVTIMDVTTSSIGNSEGLFEKLTPAEFPVLNELLPEARAAGGDYGPAVTFDHLVLVYDATLQPPLAKLADLWRPDLKGLLAVSAPPNIQGLALTAMVEKMEGGDHRKSIDAAIRKLKALAPSVNTFEPNPDGYSLILNGVVKVATGWNARSQLYADQTSGKIATLLPPEGSVFQINTINLTTGSKNRAVAAAFVNHALSQPAQKAFTERMFYAPTNGKAQIDPKAIARTAAAPESRSRMIDLDWNEVIKVRDQWNNRWRREVVTAR